MAHGGRGSIASRCAVGVVVLLAGVARAADAPASSGTGAPAPITGSRSRGVALFTGARRLQNGGAPCGACHAVGGEGPWLAASLGPDLSHSFDGMPAEAIDGMLTDLPFPTMAPVFAGRALTAQERADLGAFLGPEKVAPAPSGNGVAGAASAIGVLLLAVMGARARRRKVPTRGTLVAHPPAPARAPRLGRPISADAPSSAARTAQGGSR